MTIFHIKEKTSISYNIAKLYFIKYNKIYVMYKITKNVSYEIYSSYNIKKKLILHAILQCYNMIYYIKKLQNAFHTILQNIYFIQY